VQQPVYVKHCTLHIINIYKLKLLHYHFASLNNNFCKRKSYGYDSD